MRATVLAACLALVLFCVSGCARYQGLYRGQQLTVRSDVNAAELGGIKKSEYNRDRSVIEPFNLDTSSFSGGGTCNPDKTTKIMDAANRDNVCRNRLADHLIGLSNDMCAQHKVRIHSNAALINTSATALATTLGGIGALVTGSDASRILSGSAGMTTALQSNVNENIFQNQLASAILKQIDNQREAKLKDIRAHYNENTKTYSAEHMVADVNDYNNLCAFSEALANLGNETKRPPTKDEIRGQIQELSSQLETNKRLLTDLEKSPDYTKEKAEIHKSNEALLKRIGSLQVGLAPEAASSEGARPASTTQGNSNNQNAENKQEDQGGTGNKSQ